MKKNLFKEDLLAGRYQSTYDYNKFKKIVGNRDLDNANLKRLIESMQVKDMKVPIMVTKDFRIIDGQHRLEARRRLLLPVYYIVNENAEGVIDDVILATMAGKPVTTYDIAKYRAASNEKEYLKLLEFKARYNIPLNMCINLLWKGLSKGADDKKILHEFKLGEFKCEFYDFACRVGDYIIELYNVTNSDIMFKTYFVYSLINVIKMNGFDKDFFINQIQRNKHLLEKKATRKQYQDLIHDIYNYKARDNKRLNLRAV